ncbi:MAG: hypothetical protein Q4G58_17975, partial [bacterium]|nr:hypothetical protein [bacterium]
EDEKRDLNKEGLTALHIASFDENTGLVNLLIKSGADTNRKDQYGIAITDLDNDTIRNKIYNELY